ERPPHATLEGLELAQRRARDGDQDDVARGEVHDAALEIVGPERAALAPLLPVGREHEMVDNQLRASGEQVAERDLAVRPRWMSSGGAASMSNCACQYLL